MAYEGFLAKSRVDPSFFMRYNTENSITRMTFPEAVAALAEHGYVYHCRRMISGCDFTTPEGQKYLTEAQVISLAKSLS